VEEFCDAVDNISEATEEKTPSTPTTTTIPTCETTEATPTTSENTNEDANTMEINNATTPNNNDKATIDDLTRTVEKLRHDLDDAKSEVAVADYVKESLVQTERQKESLQEELATMQALLIEATEGQAQESQLMKMRKKAKALESENQDLRIQLRMSEGRRNSVVRGSASGGGGLPKSPLSSSSSLTAGMDKDSLLGSAAVISDRTKNMVRKMKSTVVQSFPQGGGSAGNLESLTNPSSPGVGLVQDEESQVLRALIVPLEEQISALKGKLRETDSLLQTYEKRSAQTLLEMQIVGEWLSGQDKSVLEARLAEAAGDGYNEDSGQLYHAILAARIGMLSQELEAALVQVKSLSSNLMEKSSEVIAEKVNSSELLAGILQSLEDDSRSQILETFGSQIQRIQNPETEGSGPATKLIVSSEDWLRMKTTLEGSNTSLDKQPSSGDTSEAMTKLKDDLANLTKERASLLNDKDALAKEKEHLLKNCAKYKDDLSKEAAFRQEIEETWNIRGSEYRTHVETLQAKLQSYDEKLEKISVAFLKFKEESRIELKKLTIDREKIVKELKRLQNENDNLVGKHSSLAETMNDEVINLPESLEGMQLLLLQYREDLITAKVGKERAEEKLASEVGFMKQQLNGEQQARTAIQNQYSTQLQELEIKIRNLEPAHQHLEAERLKRKEFEEKLTQVQSLQNQTKLESSKNLEAARTEKESADAQIAHLKNKVFSLQTDLDNSVAVQNDFVRLSQNLQMELEKIRQSEKEVRWQHEEDVSECNSCRNSLHKKKKDNCRHCGRIFCQDCLQKKVSSGPSGRQAPVCDVCHTLLVQNSAPYFASETPNQN